MEQTSQAEFIQKFLDLEINMPWKCITVCLEKDNCFYKRNLSEKIECHDKLYDCVQQCKKSVRDYNKSKNKLKM